MRIEKNITVFAREAQGERNAQSEREVQSASSADKAQKSTTIFAGDLNGDFTLRDKIQQKKEAAQKQAMKVVEDAWNSERAVDDDLNSRRQHIKELEEQNKEIQAELKDIEKQKQDLEEACGVTSEEYQEKLAALNDLGKNKQKQLQQNEQDIVVENAVIRGTKQELRSMKRSPMQSATEQTEEIMDAASDEVIGMVMEDAKEHLDEEQAEREEQAENIKEQREEQEEIIEKRKEKEEELEELTEDMPVDEMVKLENAKTEVQQEIQNIVEKMNLVAEDIKGSMVDTSI